MPSQTAPSTDAQGKWAEMLDNVQNALEAVLAETTRREQEIAELFPAATPRVAEAPPAWHHLDAHLAELESAAERAAAEAAETSALLAEQEALLRSWLASAVASRQKLEEWADHEV